MAKQGACWVVVGGKEMGNGIWRIDTGFNGSTYGALEAARTQVNAASGRIYPVASFVRQSCHRIQKEKKRERESDSEGFATNILLRWTKKFLAPKLSPFQVSMVCTLTGWTLTKIQVGSGQCEVDWGFRLEAWILNYYKKSDNERLASRFRLPVAEDLE